MRNFAYQVQEQVFDGKSLLDEQNFYSQNQGKPSELTRKLTYILGDYNKNYPISMMTMGNIASEKSSIELDDVQFTYPVIGRDDKATSVAYTSYVDGTDYPGYGFAPFYIYFTDNWIKRYYIIESPRGVQAYVLEDPIQEGNYWKYKVQLDPAEEDDYCPVTELQPGSLWVDLNVQVAESESRGSRSKMTSTGLWKNQMGFIRASMEWAGNSANKFMNIEVETDKGSSKGWMDFFMWQFEKRWLNECEHVSWYSRYNRLADGSIPLKDLMTGKVIPRGSGMLEQIQHKSTFSKLTHNSLVNKIGDALFGQADTQGMTITLHTGKGGMRDIDRAMKEAGIALVGDFSGIASKFVTGSGYDLMLGGFFNGFYHVDGYIIKVKYNPIFDHGRIALKSPKHPETGFPLESHRLVFVDDNDYDGNPNIQHVAQTNRAYLHGVVPGLTAMPRSLKIMGGFNLNSDAVQILSDEGDKGSYHRFKSAGIQMLRSSKCFDMQCVAGL
jgi:hypothetical protein